MLFEKLNCSPADTAFTHNQMHAIQGNPRLRPMYRGNRIDVHTRFSVKKDPFLHNIQSNYGAGLDFGNPKTCQWLDITTPKQWPGHVKKYGPGGTLLSTE